VNLSPFLRLHANAAQRAATVINSTGGTNGTNGLRIYVGGSGQIRILARIVLV
jgi:hypothetical protein